MEHELCDEGGGNCWLLPFLLPTARRELFYRRIWLCNSPAGVCPALPKSAVRARLSGGSRRLRLPGLQPSTWLRREWSTVLPTIYPRTNSEASAPWCLDPYMQLMHLFTHIGSGKSSYLPQWPGRKRHTAEMHALICNTQPSSWSATY